MSAGHHGAHKLSDDELDDLLAEALANHKVKKRLAAGFKLVTEFDIALLGSSSIGGQNVYLDRHLRYRNWPYGVIPVRYRRLDVKPGLIRHERLEQAIEDELGWPYDIAHPVAQRYEEKDYSGKGFHPRDVEVAFRPFIKADSVERIVKTPTDLDMRPLLSPPRSEKLIERINKAAQKEKRLHEREDYLARSPFTNRKCGKCGMFVEKKYGGPACTLVQSPIVEPGYCRRFKAGKLGDWRE